MRIVIAQSFQKDAELGANLRHFTRHQIAVADNTDHERDFELIRRTYRRGNDDLGVQGAGSSPRDFPAT
jgi:hypothetical protein